MLTTRHFLFPEPCCDDEGSGSGSGTISPEDITDFSEEKNSTSEG